MGDLKNMRKKIYCSGWGAISERVPKPFDLIRISVDRYNCSYVLGQILNLLQKKLTIPD
ncbi:hypothetical protein LEP1GSC016_1764 [Leptospira borgpetersenii serovar Hardjo-bovis str. Sponselee]|uniref:Uncharacterized protein n=1 Tax=Leptospira borgpetersenii serovar Hardjo-bovis str. Sponselee TaxID=1303729 RepID=M6BL60_LEPBO|nr:hypothetical protein LEP1GSC016_1764 [Leptospira borgpetersenii serovar Hardjo-bovis str. Sponselee]